MVNAKDEKRITGGAVPKDFMEGVGDTLTKVAVDALTGDHK